MPLRVTFGALLAAGLLAIGAPLASAHSGPHAEPGGGDNGTVKVHRSTTSAQDMRNQPKVCEFYLVGFHFDGQQAVSWQIKSWPPTGDRTVVKSGALGLDQDGWGRTEDMSLPDGHYKLYWNFAGEKGRAKQKVFWVRCPGAESPTPTPSESTPTTPSSPPSARPSPSPTESTPAPSAGAPTPVRTNLPVTG